MRTEASVGGAGAPDAPGAPGSHADVDQLRQEVAGLRRALESRPLIEQAKGVLMQRHGWTADQSFDYLVRLSQHLNVRLAQLAATLVAEAASPRGIAPTDEACAYRLLDLLIHPAMTLRPVPGDGTAPGAVADFNVEYANPAAVDLFGRTPDQLVGRRLSKLYPRASASDIVAACVRAWQSQDGRVETMTVSAVDGSPSRAGRLLRLRAVPFLDRLLLTW